MISIREVSPRYYAETLIKLQLATLPNDEPLMPSEKGRWWLANDSDLYIAFACLMPARGWKDASYLARSGVIRSYRGKGIQRRLIRVRENAARREGKTTTISDCVFDNIPSANNLIASGYKLYKPSTPWGLPESIYWEKPL